PGYLADEGKTQGGREKAQLTHREGLLALKIRQETRRALSRDGTAVLVRQGAAGRDDEGAAARGAQAPRAPQLRGRELPLALYQIPVVEQPVRARGQLPALFGEPVLLPAYEGEHAPQLPRERPAAHRGAAGFGHFYHLSFRFLAWITFPRPGASYTGELLKKNT